MVDMKRDFSRNSIVMSFPLSLNFVIRNQHYKGTRFNFESVNNAQHMLVNKF